MGIFKIIVKASLAIPYIYDGMLSVFYKRVMKYCGPKVYLRPSSSDFKGLQNLSVGGGVQVYLNDRLSIVQRLRVQ